jgi:hypothetical protein
MQSIRQATLHFEAKSASEVKSGQRVLSDILADPLTFEDVDNFVISCQKFSTHVKQGHRQIIWWKENLKAKYMADIEVLSTM